MVFNNEADLKKHRLTDHNDAMTRNERRAALNIPVNLTVRCSGYRLVMLVCLMRSTARNRSHKEGLAACSRWIWLDYESRNLISAALRSP